MKIKKDVDNEIEPEVFEQAILDAAKGIKILNQSRLSRGAVVALIKDKSGLTKTTIEIVLNNLDALERIWLKPKKKP